MKNEFLTVPLEIKALESREFEGYGSVFGNKDLGDDVVVTGAFTRTLKEHKDNGTLPMMFWMHDPSRVPGKWLNIQEDKNGLYVKGVLAKTELGNEIHTLLKMEAVRGLSIGYVTQKQDFTNDGVRLLKDVDLFETSIVSIPMNPQAQIAHAKSRLSERGEYVPNKDELALLKRDCEHFLKTKGFSNSMAKLYAGNIFKDHLSGERFDSDPSERLDKADPTVKAIEVHIQAFTDDNDLLNAITKLRREW